MRSVPRVPEPLLALLLRVHHAEHVRREPAAVRRRVVWDRVHPLEREVLEEEAEGVRLGRGERDEAREDAGEERARDAWRCGGRGRGREAAFHVGVLAGAGDVVLERVEDLVGLLFGHVCDGLWRNGGLACLGRVNVSSERTHLGRGIP